MRIFPQKPKAYRNTLIVLLLGLLVGNVLIVWLRMRTAARQAQALEIQQRKLGQAMLNAQKPPPPLGPPALVLSGASTQGIFTLLAVTRTQPMILSTPRQAGVFMGEGVRGAGDGTGLWIKIASNNGVGVQTITVPPTPQRHVYPFGSATLVTTTLGEFVSYDWRQADGVTWLDESEHPYSVEAGGPKGNVLTLIPHQLSQHWRVTAQPLTGTGVPAGGGVTLNCQPAAEDTLFAQIPAGYNDKTKMMDISVGSLDTPGQVARWRLKNLPQSQRVLPDNAAARASQSLGAITIDATAADAPDVGGEADDWNRHPIRSSVEGRLNEPFDTDGHLWTGVPTIRCLLRTHHLWADPKQEWEIYVAHIEPEWKAQEQPGAPSSPHRGGPVVSLDQTRYGMQHPDAVAQEDFVCGVAYPGQQRFLRIRGAIARYGFRTEPLTFKDADVQYNAALQRWQILWRHAQTLTTASGISVAVLNANPQNMPGAYAGSPAWRSSEAEMLLAWRLPAATGQIPSFDLQAPLTGTASHPFGSPYPPPNWDTVWLPGAALPAPHVHGQRWNGAPLPKPPTDSLARAGYLPWRLYVGRIKPLAPQPLNTGTAAGVNSPIPSSLPRHLATVTVLVTMQVQMEQHPFTLMVPVAAQFPPGVNPDVADGYFQAFH